MLQKIITCILVLMGIFSIQVSHAQSAPTSADGLFGQYFINMVKPCDKATHVVTGFRLSPFGSIICTEIKDILSKIPTNTSIAIGKETPQPGSKLDVDGIITAESPTDASNGNAVVTKEYLEKVLEKRVPRIEIGTFSTAQWANSTQYVAFKKPFKNKPLVIAQPSAMKYNDGCRRDAWDFNTNPQYVTTNGFSVHMSNAGRCGGYMHNQTITYVAIENIENIFANIPPGMSIPEYETEEETTGNGAWNMEFRSRVLVYACGTYASEIRVNKDCTYTNARLDFNQTYLRQWFETVDKTVAISTPNDMVNSLIPTPFVEDLQVKKVVLTVTEREAWDWPSVGTKYVFCDTEIVKDESCKSFGTIHQVFYDGDNRLSFNVYQNPTTGQVMLRYIGVDHSPDYGGVHLIAETFY